VTDDEKPLTRGDFKLLMIEHEQRDSERQQERYKQFMKAFPKEDVDGHCAYHQKKIDAAEAEKRFWLSAEAHLLSKGIDSLFSALKIILLLALTGAAYKLGIPLPFLGDK